MCIQYKYYVSLQLPLPCRMTITRVPISRFSLSLCNGNKRRRDANEIEERERECSGVLCHKVETHYRGCVRGSVRSSVYGRRAPPVLYIGERMQ